MRRGRGLPDLESGAGQRPLEAGGPGGRVAGEQQARPRERLARGAGHRTIGGGVAHQATAEMLGAHVSTGRRGDRAGARHGHRGHRHPGIHQDSQPVAGAGGRTGHRGRVPPGSAHGRGITRIVAHDSYLINLASPDPVLRAPVRGSLSGPSSSAAQRSASRFVVSHPGNYIDDREAGSGGTPESYTRCLRAVPGTVVVLLETTAGTGTALGSTVRGAGRAARRDRRGRAATGSPSAPTPATSTRPATTWCATSTASGGSGSASIGLEQLRCLHLNDSKTPFASRRDRHELIAEGTLGAEPFRRIMRDPRFAGMIKVLETPKGDDEVTKDRRMLRRLAPTRACARRVDPVHGPAHLPRMPKTILFLALLLPAGVSGLHAQMEYYARVGAVGASTLLRDIIVNEINVRQSIAPMIALGASLPIGTRGYRVGLEGTLASGKFHSSESGSDTDLGTLRTGDPAARPRGAALPGAPLASRRRRHHLLAGGREGIFLAGGTDPIPGGRRGRLPAAGAAQVGPHDHAALRLPPIHHRRARGARLLQTRG